MAELTARQRSWTRSSGSLLVGIIVGTAAVLSIAQHASPYSPAPPPGGMTFAQASAIASPYILNESGGPWLLISVVGVGSTVSAWPDAPAASPGSPCQSLPGPSIWNTTDLTTTVAGIELGALPFWSLWYANSSQVLISVGIEDRIVVTLDVLDPSAPCSEALRNAKLNLTSSLPIYPGDSVSAADTGWQYAGEQFLAADPSTVVYFTFGAPQLFDMAFGRSWGVTYTVCGASGFGGDGAYSFVGLNGTSPPLVFINGSSTCSLTNYTISLSPPSVRFNASQWAVSTFRLGVNASLYFGIVPDAEALASWMMNVSIRNESGAKLIPAAPVGCSLVGNLSGCVPLSQGWIAVLATSSGWGVNVYSLHGSSAGWLNPVVPIYSNDTLCVYGDFNPLNYTYIVSLTSTTSAVPLTGTATW